MGYGAYLKALLRPLGVYDLDEGSFSGAELDALGAAMDDLAQYAENRQKESLVMTAEGSGLDAMTALFPWLVTAADVQRRRQALAGFLQISGDSFTKECLQRCLSACGTRCLLAETGTPGVVLVRFPDYPGEPEDFEAKKAIIESILPCHLQVRYAFSWCTFDAVAGLTWQQAEKMSFQELSVWGLEE